MKEAYLAAFRNDVITIEKHLENYPECINAPYEYIDDPEFNNKLTILATQQTLLYGLAWLTAGGLASPLLVGYAAYRMISATMTQVSDFNMISYHGWTLLECALHANASDTAIMLISRGAEITPRAQTLLDQKKLKYPQMVYLVSKAVGDRAEKMYLYNQQQKLTSENEGRSTHARLERHLASLQHRLLKTRINETSQHDNQNSQQSEIMILEAEIEKQKTRKREYKNQLIAFASVMQSRGLFQSTDEESYLRTAQSELDQASRTPH